MTNLQANSFRQNYKQHCDKTGITSIKFNKRLQKLG